MVNNSTICQQNEQSPLSPDNWTWKETTTCDVENPCPGLGQAHTCGGVILMLQF